MDAILDKRIKIATELCLVYSGYLSHTPIARLEDRDLFPGLFPTELNSLIMKAVVQRVAKASVSVEGKVISSIERGLCVLIGLKRDDTPADVEYIVRKILNTKIFDGDGGKRWSSNVMERGFEILCVSQFTLYHTMKGNKLDFHRAMPVSDSEPFYNNFLTELRRLYKTDMVKDGQFGAMMQVMIENDGPVTIELESPVKTT